MWFKLRTFALQPLLSCAQNARRRVSVLQKWVNLSSLTRSRCLVASTLTRVIFGLSVVGMGGCVSMSPTPTIDKKAERAPLPVRLGNPTPIVEEKAVLKPLSSSAPAVRAFVGADILVGNGQRIRSGVLVIRDGRITAVGKDITIPGDAQVTTVNGRFLTPGIIDNHFRMGAYPAPLATVNADENEMTDPTTPYIFSEHAIWTQDPSFDDAIAAGVTTVQVLPRSGSVIGGRSTVLKLRPRREARAMRFPGAPFGLKMTCGENPKRYRSKWHQPMSRMDRVHRLRSAFLSTKTYTDKKKRYEAKFRAWENRLLRAQRDDKAKHPGEEPVAPPRDLGKETLADVLEGRIRVHINCDRADNMLLMLSLADELGFSVASFHHASEAFKIADVLAERGVTASVWADQWGYKMETYDAVDANAAIVSVAGGQPVIHSDMSHRVQHLNQEAAKALYAGIRLGLDVNEDEALKWITRNPAVALGIERETGTLEAGKMADIVLWDKHPFSIYATPVLVLVDGIVIHDRSLPHSTKSDFDVGTDVEVLR